MPSNEHRPTERVLDILELLSTNANGMTLSELSRALDAPKSSIMPLVHTMTARKFIYMQKESSKYFIGVAAYSVGASYASHQNALQFIQSEMKMITSTINETCQLGIQNRNQILYIAKEDSTEPLRLISYVGKQLPLYCSALGRAILAEKTDEEVRQLYPNGLISFTEHTITDWSMLFEELERTRIRRYALEKEETAPMVNCVGVSLKNKGISSAALSVSVPTFRCSDTKLEEIVHMLMDAKCRIEAYFNNNDADLVS